MRRILVLAMLALPSAAMAQATNPPVSNPSAGPAMTPAPVPSVPPGTPQTGTPSIPPDRIAPAPVAPGGTARPLDRALPNSAPFSGSPPTTNMGVAPVNPQSTNPRVTSPSRSR